MNDSDREREIVLSAQISLLQNMIQQLEQELEKLRAVYRTREAGKEKFREYVEKRQVIRTNPPRPQSKD